MLDIRFVREYPDIIKKDLEKRKQPGRKKEVDQVLKLDEDYRKLLYQEEQLRHQRNAATEEINKLKKAGKDISKRIQEIKEIPLKIQKIQTKKETIQGE